jgi:prevent-host-death family protein
VNFHRRPSESEREWSVAEAKAKLSEVFRLAESTGPQVITRNGAPVAVIVSAEEWRRKMEELAPPDESLADFFARSPLREGPLDFSNPPGYNQEEMF